MATSSWASNASHTSDAEFRTWGSELSTKLQAMSSTPGLVKTSDTGQINWVTVTRPGSNTDGGYEIYYLNDSLHATSPIYIKIYYGTNSSASAPRIKIEIGTGSNGSGTLTGLNSGTTYICTPNNALTSTLTSYLCVNTGFFGLAWKYSSTAANGGGFLICRTCDTDGTPNSKGALLITRNSTGGSTPATSVAIRYESTASVISSDTNGTICLVPQQLATTTLPNGNKQAFLAWGVFPDVRPIFGCGCAATADVAAATTLSVALVGSSARTYIALPNWASTSALGHFTAVGTTNYAPFMLWE